MRNHLAKVLLSISELCALVIITGVLGFSVYEYFTPSSAQATLGMTPFGGRFLSFVPPTLPFCPAHVMIWDYASNSAIGIVTLPTGRLYEYYNLLGTYTLGEHYVIPIPGCPTPYPVYNYYQVGTSSF